MGQFSAWLFIMPKGVKLIPEAGPFPLALPAEGVELGVCGGQPWVGNITHSGKSPGAFGTSSLCPGWTTLQGCVGVRD